MTSLRKTLRLFSLALRKEWRDIATAPASLLVIVGGVVLYGVLYNLLYRPNVVRDAPVVVVDESASHISRQFTHLLNASSGAEVVARVESEQEGREMLNGGKAVAIVYLPHDMETRVGRGEESIFVALATTATFLYYEAAAGAIMDSMLALDDGFRREMIWTLPDELSLALANRESVEVVGNALFNPSKGYADYLIPVVLIIIIFQTMVMVESMNSGARRAKGITPLRGTTLGWGSRVAVTLARSAFYCLLYGVMSLFLVGLMPRIFNLPHLATFGGLVVLMTPFLLATSLFGQAFGRLFTDRDSPLLLITFFSVGLIFLSGISYPLELLPRGWRLAHYIFPAAPATLAFVELNSMGSSIADIAPQLVVLWAQTAVYLLLATLPSRGFR